LSAARGTARTPGGARGSPPSLGSDRSSASFSGADRPRSMQWHDEAEDRVGGNLRFNLGLVLA